MTASAKKQFELRMVAGLVRALGFHESTLLEASESPDVIVRHDGHLIGVEVTEIQKSTEERQLRAPKDDILQRARQIHDAAARPQISVSVAFHPEADLRSVDRSSFSRDLAGYLQSRSGGVDLACRVAGAAELPEVLRRYIREIRYWTEPTRGVWQCMEASWVAPLTVDILQQRVDIKAQRLVDYRKRGIDSCWLLVCAQPLNPACRFEAGRDFNPVAVVSPFDRTYFYDCWQLFGLGRKSQPRHDTRLATPNP